MPPNILFSRGMTFTTAGELADVDAIKTSIATAASVQTYTTFNGTSTVGVTQPRIVSWPSVTASSSAGSYVNGSTVSVTGTYGGESVTRTVTIVGTDGNATFIGDGPLDVGSVTSIVVAAQVNTSGAFQFGWSGVGPKKNKIWFLVAKEAGNIVNVNMEGDTDTTALAAFGEHYSPVVRVFATTTIDFTAYERPV